MATYISHSPAETEALGETWGRAATSGLVFGLSGDLGAGKTQLVKGLARGLGISQRVHSPTFALVNVYSGGRLPLFHLDLYRLDTPEQITSAGLQEYLQPPGVTAIEWAEKLLENHKEDISGPEDLPHHPHPATRSPLDVSRFTLRSSAFRWVQIETLSESDRRITYEAPGV
jgi:tRNA threonylcarbamoyladenosine biosynthesis protein TsaE